MYFYFFQLHETLKSKLEFYQLGLWTAVCTQVCVDVCVCFTFRVFLLGVVSECSSHTEAHVAVFAVVRFLSRVQPHVILQRRVGAKLCATFLAGKRLFFEVLSAFVVNHTWNVTRGGRHVTLLQHPNIERVF